MLEWLQQWYLSRCNGEWEHEYGVRISTLDNPGWWVEIDLAYTEIEKVYIPYTRNEISENDWLGYSIEKKIFSGGGDPQKLEQIIQIFKEIWDAKITEI